MTFNLPYKIDPHAMHMYSVMGQNLALFINIFLAFLNPHNLLSMEAYILLVAFLLFDPKVLAYTLIHLFVKLSSVREYILTTQWKKQ